MRRVGVRAAVAAVVVVLAAAVALVAVGDGADTKRVTAHFPRAVSIFEDSEVRILGVPVGRVTAVVPEGNSVRVEMEYDAEHRVPADAKAAIITPTLVSDRYVQLTPAYRQGDRVMADGADIPLPDTGVPVELDRIYQSLRDLSRALGPNGANRDGTLNHLLDVAATSLDGKGRRGNRMLRDLSLAAETFGEGSGDLFETVRNLARFTEVLATNDRLVRAFLRDLAGVSEDLAGERKELREALAAVAGAVGTVRTFVKENRAAIVTDVEKLTRVMKTIASERESLDKALTAGPVGIGNLNIALDPVSGAIGARVFTQGNIGDADGFLCTVIQQTDLPRASKELACRVLEQVLEPAGAAAFEGSGAPSPAPGPGTTQARYSSRTSSTLADLVGAR